MKTRGIRGRVSDMEFLPAALEILERPPAPASLAVEAVICGSFAAALTWSYFGRIDIISTAQGKFQPTGRVKLVQPVETGKIVEIDAENGREVHRGDVLLRLDPAETAADARDARAMETSYRAEAIRRHAAVAAIKPIDYLVGEGTVANPEPMLTSAAIAHAASGAMAALSWPDDVPDVVRERETRILKSDLRQIRSQFVELEAQVGQKLGERRRLDAMVAAQKDLVATLQSRVDMKATLVAALADSKSNLIDATETLQVQKTTLAQQLGQAAETDAAIATVRATMSRTVGTFLAENAQRLADASRQAEDFRERREKAEARLANTTLRSPIDGVVQSSVATSAGQVVAAGEEVMRVVPADARLEIECYMPNRDVGFVQPGQTAVVKIEAFPFTRYGTVRARVLRVARDAIPAADADLTETDPARASRANAIAAGQRVQNLVFPVTLVAEQATMDVDGVPVRLSPGMAVTAEIRTGSRRILEYIFSPVLQTASEAMKER